MKLFPSQVLVYDAVSYTPQHVITDVKYALQQPWPLWTAEGKWVAYAVDIPPERANPSLLEEASKLAGKVIDKMKDYGQEKYENYFNSGKEGPKEAERKFIKGMEDGWVCSVKQLLKSAANTDVNRSL